MRFSQTKISGVWLIEPTPLFDDRGSFSRTFCEDEFSAYGLASVFPQHSVSHSLLKHTIRGLHFQTSPHQEDKVVSCRRGAIWDVAVDLRCGSPTFLQWAGCVLSAQNAASFYIPKGFAHGFQTLCDDVMVSYLISTRYSAAHAHGLRYDDEALDIGWPTKPSVISNKDASWPLVTAPFRGIVC